MINNNNIKDLVNEWIKDPNTSKFKDLNDPNYVGHISDWDVSKITNMRGLFYNKTDFNSDISKWNTSSVTDMKEMFYKCHNFNQNISTKLVNENTANEYIAWDVSQVKDMSNMLNMDDYANNSGSWNNGEASGLSNNPLNWNTQNLTRADFLFKECRKFNQNVSTKEVTIGSITYISFNTENVTTMKRTFAYCESFNNGEEKGMSNKPLYWNTSKVKDMWYMFGSYNDLEMNPCYNQPMNTENVSISYLTYIAWDVSNVLTMGCMFQGQELFNQPLNKWNVSNVTNMRAMFSDCISFNQYINTEFITIDGSTNDYLAWDVSNVNNFKRTFNECKVFNQSLDKWDTQNVMRMDHMFSNCYVFNKPLNTKITNIINNQGIIIYTYSSWDVTSVWTMNNMFYKCNKFNQPLNNWDVSYVVDMQNMFSYASAFNQDIGKWNVLAVIATGNMFSYASSFNQPLNNWYVFNVTDMSYMFENCENFNQPLDKWDVSNVTNMSYMFFNCKNLDISSLNSWNIKNIKNADLMFFSKCQSESTKIPDFIEKINDKLLFGGCSWIYKAVDMWINDQELAIKTYGHIHNWDVSDINDMMYLFSYRRIPSENIIEFNENINNWNVSNVTNMAFMFDSKEYSILSTVDKKIMINLVENKYKFNQPLNNWNVSNVKNMNYMFAGCCYFNQTLNNWDVSNVTSMESMFRSCLSFNKPLHNWDVSNINNSSRMFFNAESFNQNLNSWNTSKFNNTRNMFYNSVSFNQPLDSWDVSNVTDMGSMFEDCKDFDQPLNSWDVSKVTDMNSMFGTWFQYPSNMYGNNDRGRNPYKKFNQPLDKWNTSSVTNMRAMFANCNNFNQSLNNWNVSNVTNMISMFVNCDKFNQPLDNWNVSKVKYFNNMFINAFALDQSIKMWSFTDSFLYPSMNDMFSGTTKMNLNGYPKNPYASKWDLYGNGLPDLQFSKQPKYDIKTKSINFSVINKGIRNVESEFNYTLGILNYLIIGIPGYQPKVDYNPVIHKTGEKLLPNEEKDYSIKFDEHLDDGEYIIDLDTSYNIYEIDEWNISDIINISIPKCDLIFSKKPKYNYETKTLTFKIKNDSFQSSYSSLTHQIIKINDSITDIDDFSKIPLYELAEKNEYIKEDNNISHKKLAPFEELDISIVFKEDLNGVYYVNLNKESFEPEYKYDNNNEFFYTNYELSFFKNYKFNTSDQMITFYIKNIGSKPTSTSNKKLHHKIYEGHITEINEDSIVLPIYELTEENEYITYDNTISHKNLDVEEEIEITIPAENFSGKITLVLDYQNNHSQSEFLATKFLPITLLADVTFSKLPKFDFLNKRLSFTVQNAGNISTEVDLYHSIFKIEILENGDESYIPFLIDEIIELNNNVDINSWIYHKTLSPEEEYEISIVFKEDPFKIKGTLKTKYCVILDSDNDINEINELHEIHSGEDVLWNNDSNNFENIASYAKLPLGVYSYKILRKNKIVDIKIQSEGDIIKYFDGDTNIILSFDNGFYQDGDSNYRIFFGIIDYDKQTKIFEIYTNINLPNHPYPAMEQNYSFTDLIQIIEGDPKYLIKNYEFENNGEDPFIVNLDIDARYTELDYIKLYSFNEIPNDDNFILTGQIKIDTLSNAYAILDTSNSKNLDKFFKNSILNDGYYSLHLYNFIESNFIQIQKFNITIGNDLLPPTLVHNTEYKITESGFEELKKLTNNIDFEINQIITSYHINLFASGDYNLDNIIKNNYIEPINIYDLLFYETPTITFLNNGIMEITLKIINKGNINYEGGIKVGLYIFYNYKWKFVSYLLISEVIFFNKINTFISEYKFGNFNYDYWSIDYNYWNTWINSGTYAFVIDADNIAKDELNEFIDNNDGSLNFESNNVSEKISIKIPETNVDLAFSKYPYYNQIDNTVSFTVINKGTQSTKGFKDGINFNKLHHIIIQINNDTGELSSLKQYDNELVISHAHLEPNEQKEIIFKIPFPIDKENFSYQIWLDGYNHQINELQELYDHFNFVLYSNNIGDFNYTQTEPEPEPVKEKSDLAFSKNPVYDTKNKTLSFTIINKGDRKTIGYYNLLYHRIIKILPNGVENIDIGLLVENNPNIIEFYIYHDNLDINEEIEILLKFKNNLDEGEYAILLDADDDESELNELYSNNLIFIDNSNNLGKFSISKKELKLLSDGNYQIKWDDIQNLDNLEISNNGNLFTTSYGATFEYTNGIYKNNDNKTIEIIDYKSGKFIFIDNYNLKGEITINELKNKVTILLDGMYEIIWDDIDFKTYFNVTDNGIYINTNYYERYEYKNNKYIGDNYTYEITDYDSNTSQYKFINNYNLTGTIFNLPNIILPEGYYKLVYQNDPENEIILESTNDGLTLKLTDLGSQFDFKNNIYLDEIDGFSIKIINFNENTDQYEILDNNFLPGIITTNKKETGLILPDGKYIIDWEYGWTPATWYINISNNGNQINIGQWAYVYNDDKYFDETDGTYLIITESNQNADKYTIKDNEGTVGTIYLNLETLILPVGEYIFNWNSGWTPLNINIIITENGNKLNFDQYTFIYNDKGIYESESMYIAISNYNEKTGEYIIKDESDNIGTATLKESSEITINLNKGWNLIGSSYDADVIDSESIIIPNTLYAYDNSYVTSTEINANKGYWIKCNSEGKIYLDIDQTTKSTDIQVNKGWNLIGSSIDGTLEDTESIIIPNTLYAYDNSYVTSTEINANKGYWIKCNNSGNINLIVSNKLKIFSKNIIPVKRKSIKLSKNIRPVKRKINKAKTINLKKITNEQKSNKKDITKVIGIKKLKSKYSQKDTFKIINKLNIFN